MSWIKRQSSLMLWLKFFPLLLRFELKVSSSARNSWDVKNGSSLGSFKLEWFFKLNLPEDWRRQLKGKAMFGGVIHSHTGCLVLFYRKHLLGFTRSLQIDYSLKLAKFSSNSHPLALNQDTVDQFTILLGKSNSCATVALNKADLIDDHTRPHTSS